jgi:hypothetical protein
LPIAVSATSAELVASMLYAFHWIVEPLVTLVVSAFEPSFVLPAPTRLSTI